jgi:hypothetical protein
MRLVPLPRLSQATLRLRDILLGVVHQGQQRPSDGSGGLATGQ